MKKLICMLTILAVLSLALTPVFAKPAPAGKSTTSKVVATSKTPKVAKTPSAAKPCPAGPAKHHKKIGNPAKKLAKGVKRAFTPKHHKKTAAAATAPAKK